MTTVYLVRHGETEWHDGNRYAGSSDVPLTARGHEQARALATWAAGARPDVVVSSDLSRAIDTAGPTAVALGLQLSIDPRLRELSFGAAEGLTQTEMRLAFGEALTAFLARPADSPLPDGEDPRAAIVRLRSAFDDVCTAHAGRRILLVLHSTSMRLLLCDLLGLEANDYRRIFPRVDNVAITTIGLRGRDLSLLGFNAPLPPET
jgi:broad specificity phosphatase PhoE